MRRNRVIGALGLLVLSTSAEAHGEQILSSIFAQAVTVLCVFMVLGSVRSLRAKAIAGVLGCVAGVAISWYVTADMPHFENQGLITLLGVVLPVTLSVICVLVSSRYKAKRGA